MSAALGIAGQKSSESTLRFPELPVLHRCCTVRVRGSMSLSSLVDSRFYADLERHKWYQLKSKHGGDRPTEWYAIGFYFDGGKKKSMMLHRKVMELDGVELNRSIQIDHRNLDPLDNRRENLRRATQSENQGNTRGKVNSSSRFKGVSYHRKDERWYARISKDKRTHHLGGFATEEQAAEEYNRKALELFGEFARLNKVV